MTCPPNCECGDDDQEDFYRSMCPTCHIVAHEFIGPESTAEGLPFECPNGHQFRSTEVW